MSSGNSLPLERQRKNLLYDYYEGLLTQKQRDVFSMHYMDDCSLAEIGESMGITPQAVSDMLKRVTTTLNRYEQHLHLVSKHESQAASIAEIKAALTRLKSSTPEKSAVIYEIIKLVDELAQ